MDGTAVLSDLLTTDQAARRLGIASHTLVNWRSSGRYDDQLPFLKIGSAVRYRAADVERVVREGIARTSASDTAA